MRRAIAVIAALGLLVAIAAPVLAAHDELPDSERTMIVVGGDLELPNGDHYGAVVLVNGAGVIEGVANSVVVVEGTMTLKGATVENLFVVNGWVELGAGTTVLNDVRELNSTVTRAEGVEVGGTISGFERELAAWAWFLGVAALLVWIGIAIATIVVALLVAGLAGRQVRSASGLIGREPGRVALIGLLTLVAPPLLAVLAMVTIVGIPVGLGLLLVLWPFVAFIGYVVAAIWLGEWVLRRTRADGYEPERPYLAALVGLVIALVLGIVPLATAVLSILGMGAVVLAAWRTLRGGGAPQPVVQPHPAPVAG